MKSPAVLGRDLVRRFGFKIKREVHEESSNENEGQGRKEIQETLKSVERWLGQLMV